ncbi:hypothetical protein CGZ80_14735 [Rhodopirellula sp. MGV]|nr:hypothetical protein CGZ80_14735 [Rhodopirellula sp. MGV]PNY36079.1 hypothetical protein C2E31_14880 [Rhodopirellula baltica]
MSTRGSHGASFSFLIALDVRFRSLRGRLGRFRQSDAWKPIASTSTALLSASTIQDNPTPNVPSATSQLIPLRNADRVNLSLAANCKLSSRVNREQLDAGEPPSCVQ